MKGRNCLWSLVGEPSSALPYLKILDDLFDLAGIFFLFVIDDIVFSAEKLVVATCNTGCFWRNDEREGEKRGISYQKRDRSQFCVNQVK